MLLCSKFVFIEEIILTLGQKQDLGGGKIYNIYIFIYFIYIYINNISYIYECKSATPSILKP